VRRSPLNATLLAWPLIFLPLLTARGWTEPRLAALTLVLGLAFIFYLIALFKVQRILNERGESLVYPWRVPVRIRETRRIDGVMATSIRRLVSGEDEEDVLATLRLQVGELPGEARRHYERAVERLEEANGRDWVFDKERREAALEAAEKALWKARAEYLREMIE